MRLFQLIVIAGFLLSGLLFAEGSVDGSKTTQLEAKDRENYVYAALSAVSEASQESLWNAKEAAKKIKGGCRSKMPSIEMECMLNKQKEFCNKISDENEKLSCFYYLDIVTTNKISEPFFLTNHERYKVMKNEQDNAKKDAKAEGVKRFAHQSYEKVLMDRYANLVTEMLLWEDIICRDRSDLDANWRCISRKIATFCQEKMPEIRQTWQSCTASMVWFIGNQGHLIQKPQNASSDKSK